MAVFLLLLLVIVVPVYIACGVLAYGLTLGYYQRHYFSVRERSDASLARLMALFGPYGVGIALILGERGRHGLVWRAEDSESILSSRTTCTRFPDKGA